MYLLFDLSEKDKIHLSWFDDSHRADQIFSGQNRELLVCVDKFLRKNKVNKKDIRGIMTVIGEGSFTSTRLAVTVANAFGYVLRIPLLAIAKEDADKIQRLIPKLLKQPKGRYISATYSGEPNINVKR